MSLSKELTERDALNRIRWDERLDGEDYVVHYIDRLPPELKSVSFMDMELAGDFFSVDDSLIPMHRIRKITCMDEVVWSRRRV